jgi:TadE-like protein
MKRRYQFPNRSRLQSGTTVVEFSIVGAVMFLAVFAVIEISRIVYLRTTFEEGVRRAARLATVCPIGDPLPALAARFEDPASIGVAIPGTTDANVVIAYLNDAGQVITNPFVNHASIRFVRVSLVNLQIPVMIPFLTSVFAPDVISSTAVAESLGVSPTGSPAC